MEKIARGGWSQQQILDALRGLNGAQGISFRCDVIRGNVKTRSITAGGSVTLDRFAEIQRTARLTVYEELDWLLDELKPYMLLRMNDLVTGASTNIGSWDARDALGWTWDQWDALGLSWDALDAGLIGVTRRKAQYAEFPLGVFVLSTPRRSSEDGFNTWGIEAYDRTVILKEDCITEPLYIAAGTTYMDALEYVLVSASITQMMVTDYVTTALPADRIFEIGTTKLEIANTLLAEINFNPIHCDIDGRFVISAYKEPSPNAVDFAYRADEFSIIGRDTSSETNFYRVPNVFIAQCSNPDLDQDYMSVWENDNPVSPFSAIRRGRRIASEIYMPDVIASQGDLDAYLRRKAFEESQVYEDFTFTTALMPIHGSGDVLEIVHPDVSGVFVESGWELPLSSDGQMTHTARRLVLI